MKLNIQLFAEGENKENELTAEKFAEMMITVDSLKETVESLKKDNEEKTKKYEDEHKANIRLMNRINEREEKQEKEEKKEENKKVKLTDFYDYEHHRVKLTN